MAELSMAEATTQEAAQPDLPDARMSLGEATLDDLFPEGALFRRSLTTYVVLLALAGLIASFGLYQDSTASIIGAMVIAPLGGAIMAFAGALVTGRLRWQTIALLQVVLGALMVVAIGFLVALVLPDLFTLTPALEARTAPTLLDLGVALASGAAGAYVAARRMGTDALPGVAIAVSLVPPLATVGICLKLGLLEDAGGALLLFLTNFTAIVVIACIVFVLSGAMAGRALRRERRRLEGAFVVALVALIVIAIPLAWWTASLVQSDLYAIQGAPIVADWIGTRDLRVVSWSVSGSDVTIDVTGSDPPASASSLATSLAQQFGAPVNLTVNYTASSKESATGSP